MASLVVLASSEGKPVCSDTSGRAEGIIFLPYLHTGCPGFISNSHFLFYPFGPAATQDEGKGKGICESSLPTILPLGARAGAGGPTREATDGAPKDCVVLMLVLEFLFLFVVVVCFFPQVLLRNNWHTSLYK